MGIFKKTNKKTVLEPKTEEKPRYIEQVGLMGIQVRAAKEGNAECMLEVAKTYSEGLLLQKNYREAVAWLMRAVATNTLENYKLARAYYDLGFYHENGGYGMRRDSEKARSYYTSASKLGCTAAIKYVTALKYHDEKKYGAAYSLFLEFDPLPRRDLVRQEGHSDAAYYLGLYFLEGYGAEKDYKKAVSYFNTAVTYDHPNAMLSLAECYRYGLGVAKDTTKAIELCEQVQKQGDDALSAVAYTHIQKIKSEIVAEKCKELHQDAQEAEKSEYFENAFA